MKLPDEPFEAFDYVLCSGERCDHCVHIRSYFSDLRSLCEQLKEDAERYRWMRDNATLDSEEDLQREGTQNWSFPNVERTWFKAAVIYQTLDAAIDAARKESDDKA